MTERTIAYIGTGLLIGHIIFVWVNGSRYEKNKISFQVYNQRYLGACVSVVVTVLVMLGLMSIF